MSKNVTKYLSFCSRLTRVEQQIRKFKKNGIKINSYKEKKERLEYLKKELAKALNEDEKRRINLSLKLDEFDLPFIY